MSFSHPIFATLDKAEHARLYQLNINARVTPRTSEEWENNRHLLEETIEAAHAEGQHITLREAYLWGRHLIGEKLRWLNLNDFVSLIGVNSTGLDDPITFKGDKLEWLTTQDETATSSEPSQPAPTKSIDDSSPSPTKTDHPPSMKPGSPSPTSSSTPASAGGSGSSPV